MDSDSQILIKELSHKVGLESPDAFSRAFKETTGKTATQWKNSIKVATKQIA